MDNPELRKKSIRRRKLREQLEELDRHRPTSAADMASWGAERMMAEFEEALLSRQLKEIPAKVPRHELEPGALVRAPGTVRFSRRRVEVTLKLPLPPTPYERLARGLEALDDEGSDSATSRGRSSSASLHDQPATLSRLRQTYRGKIHAPETAVSGCQRLSSSCPN